MNTLDFQPRTHAFVLDEALKTPATAFAAMAPGLQAQLREDVAPAWGVGNGDVVEPTAVAAVIAGVVPIRVHAVTPPAAADSGALAEHGDLSDGTPDIDVFEDLLLQFGIGPETPTPEAALSAAISHELVEARVDSDCQRQSVLPGGKVVAVEACLHGDVELMMASGTVKRIADLVGQDVNVRAIDETGSPCIAHATNIRKTRTNAPVIRIVLSNGHALTCTPDHRIMLADRSYRAAGELDVGAGLFVGFAAARTKDGRSAHAETLSDHASGLAARANLSGERVGKHGIAVDFAARDTLPSHALLRHGVVDVVRMRAEKEVFGVHAGGCVAAMTHEQSIRDRPDVHFVAESVHVHGSPADAHLSVTGGMGGPGPQPAVLGLVDARPEATLNGWAADVVRTPSSGEGLDRTMISHAPVMGAAESLGEISPCTALDGASTLGHVITVDRIEDAGNADVYDLAVPATRNAITASGVIVHNCDQVQAITYEKNGAIVSDFNTPSNFAIDGALAGPFDFLGKQTEQFQCMPGGYEQWLDPDAGWQMVTANRAVAREEIDAMPTGMARYRTELAFRGIGRHAKRKRVAAARMAAARMPAIALERTYRDGDCNVAVTILDNGVVRFAGERPNNTPSHFGLSFEVLAQLAELARSAKRW